MTSWGSLTFAEQTLMRQAMKDCPLIAVVQIHGMELRWAGAADAPPMRSYTDTEQRDVIPLLAGAAVALVDRGMLLIKEGRNTLPSRSDVVTSSAAREALADLTNWIWDPKNAHRFALAIPEAFRERWQDEAWPKADATGFPTWSDLTVAERDIVICAFEVSGWLTGPFGNWPDPTADLDETESLAFIDAQLAPLIPFVRSGWMEVHHVPDADSFTFTVIPPEDLRAALADPAIRYQGDEWGIGVTCNFTYAGYALMCGGAWSRT